MSGISQRFFKFFSSEKGRKVAFGITATSAIGLFSVNFIQHTVLLQKYREIVAAYRNGEERPLSNSIRQRFDKAVELLNVPEFERKLLKPFIVFGFDLFNAGSTRYKYGGIVGIPSNFFYTEPNDIEKSEITFRGQPVNWNTESGQILEENIVFSEDEQVFGIMREILQLQSQKILLNAIYPTSSLFIVYTIATAINQKLGLLKRPFVVRGVMYSILSFFGYGLYCFMTDVTQVHYDTETDKTLASLGSETVEAGARFYDKMLKKNIAIRKLTNESTYTAYGNENFLFRHKKLPLSVRKAFFEMKQKEYEKLQQKEAEVSS